MNGGLPVGELRLRARSGGGGPCDAPPPRDSLPVHRCAGGVAHVQRSQSSLHIGPSHLVEVELAEPALGGEPPVRTGTDTGDRAEDRHRSAQGVPGRSRTRPSPVSAVVAFFSTRAPGARSDEGALCAQRAWRCTAPARDETGRTAPLTAAVRPHARKRPLVGVRRRPRPADRAARGRAAQRVTRCQRRCRAWSCRSRIRTPCTWLPPLGWVVLVVVSPARVFVNGNCQKASASVIASRLALVRDRRIVTRYKQVSLGRG